MVPAVLMHVSLIDIKIVSDAAKKCDELRPEFRWSLKVGSETWTCAWAPDASYFAWSCGGRTVKLVPWDSQKGKM